MTRDSNPFSTRYTRPGEIPFAFEGQAGPRPLIERLAASGWWGQIVGPHGVGKSTLLQTLLPELESAGRQPELFALRQGQRVLPVDSAGVARWNERTQVVVDGYEQLGWWYRRRLRLWCRRRGAGLLVTAHRPVGLPHLITVTPSHALMRRLVRHLWPEHDRLITDREIDACFNAQQGNVRETLFALYDLYERRTGRPR